MPLEFEFLVQRLIPYLSRVHPVRFYRSNVPVFITRESSWSHTGRHPFRSVAVWSAAYFRTLRPSDFSIRGSNFSIALYATTLCRLGRLGWRSHRVISPSLLAYRTPSLDKLPPTRLAHLNRCHLFRWASRFLRTVANLPSRCVSRSRISVCQAACGPLGFHVSFRQHLTMLP